MMNRGGLRGVGQAFLLSLLLFITTVFPAEAAPVQTAHVEAELISEVASVSAGRPFFVALRLKMEKDWHTYWRNPGSSGEQTSIAWTLPPGFTASPIIWPAPHRFDMSPLVSYAYDDEVLLPVKITPPAKLRAGGRIKLTAAAKWLVCKDVCLPGRADLAIELPVGKSRADTVPRWIEKFKRTWMNIPRAIPGWKLSAQRTRDGFRLSIEPPSAGAPGDRWKKGLYFFAAERNIVEPAAPQKIIETPGGVEIAVARSSYATGAPKTLRGVLVSDAGWDASGIAKAMEIDLALADEIAANSGSATPSASSASSSSSPSEANSSSHQSLPALLFFAFLGGLILNLMPCVFPILSIKILGFVRQSGEELSRVRRHGFVFAAGVMISFWILTAVFLSLRAAGSEIGWGFQLQSPGFVIAMSIIFTLIALNLFGVFEWGGSLMGIGGGMTLRSGYAGSFWSGALTTIVATPCTAPFMGAALGVAVVLPAVEAVSLFTALGAGLAAPYLILSAYPGWLVILPKPGRWMKTFQQLMAFPLLGAAIWLVGVYAELTDSTGVTRLLAGILLSGAGAWVYGQWGASDRSSAVRITAVFGAALLIAVGFAGAMRTEKAVEWEAFSPERVESLRADGKPVFVDFTAAWCITCQVNKLTTLSTAEVEDAFRKKNVATLRADWTRNDPIITRALEKLGRSAVPVYALYPADLNLPPDLLPEILTPAIVRNALEKL